MTISISASASIWRTSIGSLSKPSLNAARNSKPSRICAPRISIRVSSSAVLIFFDSCISRIEGGGD
jgi:hypothetical protein